MDASVDRAPVGEYEPDESYVESLFARPAGRALQKRETFVAGHAFGGVSGDVVDQLRWANLHRLPVKIKEEER